MFKVIGAGFGRTGTSSLQVALEELLGGKCYHMKDIMLQPAQLQAWHDFAVGKTPVMDWKRLFAGYTAAVDCPVCMYYEELMEAFPEARVILTVRDPQHWWKSFNRLMSIVDKARLLRFLAPKLRKVARFTDKIIIQDVFEGRMEKEHCIRIFEMHNNRVRKVVPKDRLLEYNITQGWEPLCKFLKVPIPETPFPHLNAGKRSLYKLFGKTLFNDFMSR
jgi:hypothetical protein